MSQIKRTEKNAFRPRSRPLGDVRVSQVQFLLVVLAKTRAFSKNILGARVLLKKTNYSHQTAIDRV